ncbi:DUF58 domain-containing protein [Oceanobacillus sp. 1P07AA]|uniref:DUF58 domain-containing protein n=1 Tax=Oceanobacillus sp. 1P07AA TaxID=3132293 RepID=UPI0039A5F8F5
MKAKIKATWNITWLVLLIVILFSYAMFQGGFVSWFLFYSFLPIFLYQLLLSIYPFKKWEISREIPRSVVQAGDEIYVTIHMKRNSSFPLFYCSIREQIPDSLMVRDVKKEKYRSFSNPNQFKGNRTLNRMVFPLFRKRISFTYSIQQVPRGEHELRAVTLRTGDIFGLIKKQVTIPVENKLVVFPYIHDLKIKDRITSYDQGAVASAVVNQSNTNIATGVREYAPGDRVSWIDWKQTARRQDVMTKEFEQEKSTEILVILDSCNSTRLNQLAYEASIEITSSLLMEFQKKDHQANFLSIGQESHFFPSKYGKSNHSPVNRYFIHAQPSGTQPFSIRLREELKRNRKSESIFIIVTHVDDFLMQIMLEGKVGRKYLAVIFIQAGSLITEEEHRIIQQMRLANIHVQMITDQHLLESPIEVNVR